MEKLEMKDLNEELTKLIQEEARKYVEKKCV